MTEIRAQRFEKVEYAATELIGIADAFKDAQSIDAHKWQCRKLLEAARRYGRAIENLARGGK